MLLGRPNFARDVFCFLLADLPGRVIVVRANVIGGVIGGVHGPLHRPGECRGLVRLHPLQDDLLTLDDVVELEMPHRRMASQLLCKPCS
jgi:hypothetical protein